jgi:hypothetical protein
LFITSVDAACVIDPGFCAEIMGQIVQNHGAIVAAETGDQCQAEDANRVANGFRTVGAIATTAQLAAGAAQLASVFGGVTSLRMTADQQALKELVDEVTNGARTPLSVDDANTVIQWAQEVKYPGFRASVGDVGSPSNWVGGSHIHLPGVGSGHIPVAPGVSPISP